MHKLLLLLATLSLLAACSHPAKETFKVGNVHFTMVRVDEGVFKMGATPDQGNYFHEDELPVHRAQLSQFYIGETEVTQALWEAVMGTTIEDLRKDAMDYLLSTDAADTDLERCQHLYGEGPDMPVYYVSWEQAQEFCRRLSELTGRQFSLPTETQWAYAARGGKMGKNYMYSGSNNMHEVGWTDEKPTEGSAHPVAQLLPNELGLYDMTGNVWEHCHDWYGPYPLERQVDPYGPDTGTYHVLRGAGWGDDKRLARTSARAFHEPNYRSHNIGFRLALAPKE